MNKKFDSLSSKIDKIEQLMDSQNKQLMDMFREHNQKSNQNQVTQLQDDRPQAIQEA